MTLMDMSHCCVPYTCLGSCICDILLPLGSLSPRHSASGMTCQIFLQVSAWAELPQIPERGLLATEGEALFCHSPINWEENWNQKASWCGLHFQAGCESHRFTHALQASHSPHPNVMRKQSCAPPLLTLRKKRSREPELSPLWESKTRRTAMKSLKGWETGWCLPNGEGPQDRANNVYFNTSQRLLNMVENKNKCESYQSEIEQLASIFRVAI